MGQHFLVDPNTVRRIVRLADIKADETILEIGPGLGSLTVALAEAAERVVAIELDARVAEALSEVIDGAGNIEVVVGDAMDVDIAAVGCARLVANLPYNVATPLLMRVLDDVPSVSGGLVMVQRELGMRWTASAGDSDYSSVSIHVDFHTRARVVGDVPRTVFMPPPKVSSVLVAFERRAEPPVEVDDATEFLSFVRHAFGHRRKTIRNSLTAAGFEKDAVERALMGSDVDAGARPQTIGIGQFADLYARLRSAA